MKYSSNFYCLRIEIAKGDHGLFSQIRKGAIAVYFVNLERGRSRFIVVNLERGRSPFIFVIGKRAIAVHCTT
ncbi:MAG: hypothetical protein ACKO4S_17685 [Snowella sp.]